MELSHARRYGQAIKTLLHVLRVRNRNFRTPLVFSGNVGDMMRRGLAVFVLSWVVARYAEHQDEPLLEFYGALSDALAHVVPGLSLKGVRPGRFKDAAGKMGFADIIANVSPTDEARTVRTIHKAKGEEFSSVLVYLEKSSRARDLMVGGAESESQRVSYVALSRAINKLVILASSLPEDMESDLRRLDTITVVCE